MSGEERDQECLEIEANFLFPGGVLGVKNESDSDTIENNVCVFWLLYSRSGNNLWVNYAKNVFPNRGSSQHMWAFKTAFQKFFLSAEE